MADNAVYDRAFRKLVTSLKEHNVDLKPICSALFEVESDNANKAVADLDSGNYGDAKDLVDELDLVITRFLREANCLG